ncbi:MAG: sulfatase-like hydrolase/transferase [Acidobacteria bacterium]|nr:sulfatase-like hydrolase/transferase [Acidobacteriota bacterium]
MSLRNRSPRQALIALAVVALAGVASVNSAVATPQMDKPNILVLWGDDVGLWNISAYNRGMMGYHTPNIDRIANEGMLFTDAYGEQSCTAGRAAFLTGQSGFRTGLLKVGLPGADLGLQPEDVTLAELLKPHGYATGQFGKNHLGDRDDMLPTNHGFDEFFGNLYHLNAEEEPENQDYPTDEQWPGFKDQFGPRGVIHSYADGRVEDTGPLTKKRMETIDDEVMEHTQRFIRDQVADDTPFFVWFNTTRMHIFTHLKEASQGATGLGVYPDGMVEHDGHIGQLLDLLDELGVDENTIVYYSTDNGAETFTWPDGGTTPFRGEKNTNWEGGYRVPAMMRWPGVIEPGTVNNQIFSHMDVIPTLMAAVGEPDIKEKLKAGYNVGGTDFKVHLDGYNFLPYFKGETDTPPRIDFFYFSDDGNLVALRHNNWKVVFAEQRAHGFDVWEEPFVFLRVPKLFNLRTDPFERADHEAMSYPKWRLERLYALVPAQVLVGQFLATFQEFPPRQTPASFSIDQVLERLQSAGTQ